MSGEPLPSIEVMVGSLFLLFCAWQEAYASSPLFPLVYFQTEICSLPQKAFMIAMSRKLPGVLF